MDRQGELMEVMQMFNTTNAISNFVAWVLSFILLQGSCRIHKVLKLIQFYSWCKEHYKTEEKLRIVLSMNRRYCLCLCWTSCLKLKWFNSNFQTSIWSIQTVWQSSSSSLRRIAQSKVESCRSVTTLPMHMASRASALVLMVLQNPKISNHTVKWYGMQCDGRGYSMGEVPPPAPSVLRSHDGRKTRLNKQALASCGNWIVRSTNIGMD